MRITLMAVGSRGDVQPLTALGVGLRQHGHTVSLAAADEFSSLVTSADLDFLPLGFTMRDITATYSDLYQLMAAIRSKVLRALANRQDAIISTFMGISTCTYARARSIPYFYAMLMPGLHTRSFPHPIFPPLALGGAYNALTYRLADRMALRACPDVRCLLAEPRPTYLCAFSSQVVPHPADWGDFAQETGYWFLNTPADYHPPQDLEAFLQAGSPPIVISLGSIQRSFQQQTALLLLRALAEAGQRGIFLASEGGAAPKSDSKDILVTGSVSHEWLYPRTAAVIHHGGAGNTASALRAGIPSIVIPFGGDQFYWGRRLADLHAAVTPLPAKHLTIRRLVKAIRSVVDSRELGRNAKSISERIRQENGVERAVEIIEREMGSKSVK
jgi:sterol 3beta-glucosyltransferase